MLITIVINLILLIKGTLGEAGISEKVYKHYLEQGPSKSKLRPVQKTDLNKRIYYYCSKCNFNLDADGEHCYDCDICIEKYHHHCIFFSKCIGHRNKCAFYATPIMLGINLILIVTLYCFE